MKTRNSILCKLNLLSFLLSFSFLITSSIVASGNSGFSDFHHTKYESKKTLHEQGSQQLSENETENEFDDAFELQSFVLPYFTARFEQELVFSTTPLSSSLAKSTANPIYVAVCNFRI